MSEMRRPMKDGLVNVKIKLEYRDLLRSMYEKHHYFDATPPPIKNVDVPPIYL